MYVSKLELTNKTDAQFNFWQCNGFVDHRICSFKNTSLTLEMSFN